MRRFFLAGLLILFGATAGHAALTDTKVTVRIKNLSALAAYTLQYTRRVETVSGHEASGYWPLLGYIGKGGLTKDAPPEDKRLGTGEDSGWIKLAGFGSILHIWRQGEKPWRTEVEVQLQGDKPGQALSRKIVWEGEEPVLHVYLHLHPVSFKGGVQPSAQGFREMNVLCIKTFDEVMQENEDYIRLVLQDCPWKKTPRRLAFYSDLGARESDGPAVVQRQLNFLREVGVNGLYSCDPPVFPLLSEKGFSYLLGQGTNCSVFTVQDAEKLQSLYNNAALSVLGPYERYGVCDKVRALQLGDELSNGALKDYLEGGEKSRAQLVGCLKALDVPPSEFGFKDYSELKLASADALRKSNPALYYWANRARMEGICDQWKLLGEETFRYFPKALASPDWAIGGYETGGYDQQAYDYWMLYRRKALNGVWGETWSSIDFTNYLYDMMRCEGKRLPLGVFELAESCFAPVGIHYKVYGELIRGATDIAWFSYGGLLGIEDSPWSIRKDVAREIALIHREAAEAEQYLLDTQLEPAEVALLWTPAQHIWAGGLNHALTTSYYAVLHANYACDVMSSYDVDDGLLDHYKVLYMPYDYVEKRTWEKIQQWTEKGGSLVMESGNPRDEYNRPLSLEEWLPGFKAEPVVKGDFLNVVSYGYQNVAVLPVIEKTKPVAFPVIFSKTVLTAPREAKVFLTYADGRPAAFSMSKGNGRVTVFGFHPGASYAWDEANRDRVPADEGGIFHGFNAALREGVTAPIAQAGIERVGGVNKDMVVARRRVGGGKECVALFDYGFGQPPEKKDVVLWEDVKECRVQVQLTYPAEKARSLRGEILSRQGNTVEVAFHGVDMILVDEK